MYRVKAGHVVRVLGAETPLREAATAKEVDRYIDARLDEGASRNTIAKELTALRGALRVAKRRGEWTGEIDAVMPINFAPEYRPRTRVLRTGKELQNLCARLPPDRAAHVCLIVAFGLRDSEAHRLRREDFDRAGAFVRGTKTDASHARVSIVADFQSVLLDVALASLPKTGPLLRRWPNIRRDLHAACAAAGLDPLSPNDLRRTYATWLRVLGLPEDLVGPALRHAPGSKLAAKVYAHLGPSSLAHAMRSALPEAARSAVVVDAEKPPGQSERIGRGGNAQEPENAVPRDDIEPPTRGFSIPRGKLGNTLIQRGKLRAV
jgi:integrase